MSDLDVWRDAVLLRWRVSYWCNYDCSYCNQDHRRRAHAFDKQPPDVWIKALKDNFGGSKLALIITGGEPMLDLNNMHHFLTALLPLPFVDNVRIDTNTSWNPDLYKDLPCKEKVFFNCSLHPSQTSFPKFLVRIKRLQEYGFHIGMVNYVMHPDQMDKYEHFKNELAKYGLPLNPNPDWNITPSVELLKILSMTLSPLDLYFKCGGRTKGRSCLYPTLAYQMHYNGNLNVGCFPKVRGNIFKNKIPKRPSASVACPNSWCGCLDKYSFIEGVNRNSSLNLLKVYGDILRKNLQNRDKLLKHAETVLLIPNS